VKTGGIWDVKNLRDHSGRKLYPDGQAFGDFHYGALAYAYGFTWGETYNGAQAYSLYDTGGLENMMPTIKKGYEYARLHCQ
jgi:hypothetical protein